MIYRWNMKLCHNRDHCGPTRHESHVLIIPYNQLGWDFSNWKVCKIKVRYTENHENKEDVDFSNKVLTCFNPILGFIVADFINFIVRKAFSLAINIFQHKLGLLMQKRLCQINIMLYILKNRRKTFFFILHTFWKFESNPLSKCCKQYERIRRLCSVIQNFS